MQRLRITRRMPRRKLTWKWIQKTSKLVRDSKGEIDWYRYFRCILEAKLLPFAKECIKERPGTIVQEDNSVLYVYRY